MRLVSAKCPKINLNFIHAVNAKRKNDGERPPVENRKRKRSSFAKKKTKKIPGKRFALPGMAFLPVPIPALAAGRRAVVTICKKRCGCTRWGERYAGIRTPTGPAVCHTAALAPAAGGAPAPAVT